MHEILDKKEFGPNIYFMEVYAPLIASAAEPGQFIKLHIDETGERFPLTISDFNRDKGTISMVFQVMGTSTKKLSKLNIGDKIESILGPQGMPTEIDFDGTAIVTGGGIGIAPVYPLARKLKENNKKVIAVIGYRSKDYIFWEDRMREVSDELVLMTNDGSAGKKGFVTDGIKEILDKKIDIKRIYAIGPAIMMKAVADLTRPYNIETIVSLNSIMVCGMGMCGACRVTIDGKTRFVCMDGPDFDGHKVDFDELIYRLSYYKTEENESFNKYK